MSGEVSFEFITGFRKTSQLLYIIQEKQIYFKKYTRKDVSRYSCYISTCKACVLFDEKQNTVLRGNEALHPHGDQESTMKRMKFLKNIKEDCVNNTRRLSTRQLFEKSRMELNDETVDVHFKQVKRSLNRIRAQSLPKCPKTPFEVQQCYENDDFLENYGKSRYDKQSFYKHTILEDRFSYTVFMSSKVVDLINSTI